LDDFGFPQHMCIVVTMAASSAPEPAFQHTILFYKYHALSPKLEENESYQKSLEKLCSTLQLLGRILVGQEGINGTLAGSRDNLRLFARALIRNEKLELSLMDGEGSHVKELVVQMFQRESKAFFERIGQSELTMQAEDFKWSCTDINERLFPDLNIKLVKELIGTGGSMASIPLEETGKGYLSPSEWHEELLRRSNDDDSTILIDCRNTKEYEIGHFPGALDPNVTTFAQFSAFVRDNKRLLQDKKVLMYCTGGIRCEKVSFDKIMETFFIRNLSDA
jgi:UPF0176 protein